jgi:hypothetical protein
MKKSAMSYLVALLTVLTIQSTKAGLENSIYWNFGPTVPSASYASNSFSGLTVSSLTSGNSFGGYSGSAGNVLFSASSISSGYTTVAGFGSSGGTNAGIAASTIAFNTSTNAFFSGQLESG